VLVSLVSRAKNNSVLMHDFCYFSLFVFSTSGSTMNMESSYACHMDFFYFDENIRQASIYLGSEFYTFKN
jgi:hypothetical protein